MTVTLVAAVARNGVIGANGGMPWHLPGELARFKAITIGHVLVMGRRTYESIGRPLPGRTTVVVTRNSGWTPAGGRPDGVHIAANMESALRLAREIDEQVYVVGGAQVYAESLPHSDELLITEVDAEPDGDTFFPEVDWSEWLEVSREAHQSQAQQSRREQGGLRQSWALVRYSRRSSSKGYRGDHGNSA